MCGIFGYAGTAPAQPVLLDGLRRLEYRGYDSTGVAIENGQSIGVRKARGRLERLEQALKSSPLQGRTGIGHTRWATHGEPSDVNAHPHQDAQGRFALVHNGIIENHAQLRAELEREGVVFRSQTDTEVIVQLMARLWQGDLLACALETARRMEGSYALAVLCRDVPDTICCLRKDSPLVIGLGEGEQFVASDIPALLPHTRNVVILKDGEPALLRAEGCRFFDARGNKISRPAQRVDWHAGDAEKGAYEHFMLKEICEQPTALRTALEAYTQQDALRTDAFPIAESALRRARRVVLVGCGSACHAALTARPAFEKLCRVPTSVEIASEMRYANTPLSPDDLCVCVSQSGETADTLAALRMAKTRCGALAVVNAVGSSLAREADGVLYTHAGPEIAVATTKGYSTQVLVLLLLALRMAQARGTDADVRALLTAMTRLPTQADALLAGREAAQQAAQRYARHHDVFYMGRGIDSALAMEASLKMKEIAYLHSEAYAAGELKHGTIALIEQDTPVIALATQTALTEKMLSNLREVRARGAHVLALTTQSLKSRMESEADEVWSIPDTEPLLTPLLAIIPMQRLAYETAKVLKRDIDKPRNLAKSVTVE